MGHRQQCGWGPGRWLAAGRVPASPAIALLVHLLDELEDYPQVIGALRHVGCPDLLAATMMGLVHENDHRRAVGQRLIIDEAAEHMCAEHALRTRFHQCPEALDKARERRIGIGDSPRGMSRVVKHVTKLRFEENAAAIREVTRRLLRVSVGFKPGLPLLDDGERRRGSHHWLLPRRRKHFEMLDSTGDSKA